MRSIYASGGGGGSSGSGDTADPKQRLDSLLGKLYFEFTSDEAHVPSRSFPVPSSYSFRPPPPFLQIGANSIFSLAGGGPPQRLLVRRVL